MLKKKNQIKNSEQIKFMATTYAHTIYAGNSNMRHLLEKQTNNIYFIPSQENVEEYSKMK